MTTYPPPNPEYLGPPAKFTRGDNKPIYRVVLHGTVSPPAVGQAAKTASYFRSNVAGGSAHYVVDPGTVVQSAYDNVICWHAPPNPHSIGVEFCDWVGAPPNRTSPLPLSRWEDEAHYRMMKQGARLVAELCLAYDVPVRMVGPLGLRLGHRGICEHSDVSEAFGQSSHWDLGNFPRRQFLAMVRREVRAIRGTTVPKPAAPTLVTKARDALEQAYRNARKDRRKTRIDAALKAAPRR